MNVQVPVWPFGSVAVHVTTVSPTGNVSGAAASPLGVVQIVVVLLGCSSVRATSVRREDRATLANLAGEGRASELGRRIGACNSTGRVTSEVWLMHASQKDN